MFRSRSRRSAANSWRSAVSPISRRWAVLSLRFISLGRPALTGRTSSRSAAYRASPYQWAARKPLRFTWTGSICPGRTPPSSLSTTLNGSRSYGGPRARSTDGMRRPVRSTSSPKRPATPSRAEPISVWATMTPCSPRPRFCSRSGPDSPEGFREVFRVMTDIS